MHSLGACKSSLQAKGLPQVKVRQSINNTEYNSCACRHTHTYVGPARSTRYSPLELHRYTFRDIVSIELTIIYKLTVGVGGVGVVGVPMVGVPYGLREDCIWLMLSNSMRFQDLA